MHFRNRTDAGRQLGEALQRRYAGRGDVLVLALPRGGVPAGFEVARKLKAPLDIFVVRKLGVPGHEELAMGAIATGGATVFNEEVVRSLAISRYAIDQVIARERAELERRERQYRGDLPPPDIQGKTIILVDDGLATGASMHAAIQAVRALKPAAIVLAVPVASGSTCTRLRPLVDDVLCLATPEPFHAVSAWYEDFSQTTDEEVFNLVHQCIPNS
jgi:predicted phosphoribosyltransferase